MGTVCPNAGGLPGHWTAVQAGHLQPGGFPGRKGIHLQRQEVPDETSGGHVRDRPQDLPQVLPTGLEETIVSTVNRLVSSHSKKNVILLLFLRVSMATPKHFDATVRSEIRPSLYVRTDHKSH